MSQNSKEETKHNLLKELVLFDPDSVRTSQ